MPQAFTITLEKGSKKHTCPSCQKQKKYNRYINSETGEYLPIEYGYCERINNCGYSNHNIKEYLQSLRAEPTPEDSTQAVLKRCFSNSVKSVVLQPNNFVLYLRSLFNDRLTNDAVKRYHIGNSKDFQGHTVYWQIDHSKKVRTGKIIGYDACTGKRNRQAYPPVNWVHSLLIKRNVLPSFKPAQCLFGEHLLTENKKAVIGLVESEKTAVILSILLPDLCWMATGGIQNLNLDVCRPLQNRKIILYPDADGITEWEKKFYQLLNNGFNVALDNTLEQYATAKDKEQGNDLADILVKRDPKYGWALNSFGYPIFWDSLH
jgi:hypothetical protein